MNKKNTKKLEIIPKENKELIKIKNEELEIIPHPENYENLENLESQEIQDSTGRYTKISPNQRKEGDLFFDLLQKNKETLLFQLEKEGFLKGEQIFRISGRNSMKFGLYKFWNSYLDSKIYKFSGYIISRYREKNLRKLGTFTPIQPKIFLNSGNNSQNSNKK